MKYAIAVGYPLCLSAGSDRLSIEIGLSTKMHTLSGFQAVIWGQLYQMQEISAQWEPHVQNFVQMGIAVAGDTPADLVKGLLPLYLLRQGFLAQGAYERKVILGDQQTLLTPVQEKIWRGADGRHTLQQIMQTCRLMSLGPEDLLPEVLDLLKADLCYFQ